jgi:hypothetical protein
MTFLEKEVGKRYGRLEVLKEGNGFRDKNNTFYKTYICKCDCGKETEVTMSNLHSGGTTSCGCYAVENFIGRVTTHGKSYSREYKIWEGIKARCSNPNCHIYWRYGGRGITYDPKWETFEGFWEDMENGYKEDLSIDRIDGEGNYTKENCRWANNSEQELNKESSLGISINGVPVSLEFLSKFFGLKKVTLDSRIKRGWDFKRALLTRANQYNFNTLRE